MYKIFCCLLSLNLLIHYGCTSQKMAEDKSDEATMVESGEKSLLWKISGENLSQPSYLFGTIHMINSEDYFLPDGTLSAIDNSDKMVFEIDMAEINDPLKLMPVLQKAFMKGDTTLSDLMSEEDYYLVKKHFQQMGLPIFLLERIKPMFLTVFASGDFDPSDLQNGKIKSYEMEFAKMATDSNKETGGLETVEYQIGVFDEIPYKEQAIMLVESVKSGGTEDEMFDELVTLYKSQDVEGLYNMMKQDDSIMDYEDALLTRRNKNWIPIMTEMMQDQPTFFAVGAGHLGGPYGVIKLLRKQGYTVDSIK